MLTNLYVVLGQVPNGDPKSPGDLGNKLNDMVGYAKYVAFGVCVLALIGAAVMMAVQHRQGHGSEGAGGIIKVFAAVAVISGAASLVGLFV